MDLSDSENLVVSVNLTDMITSLDLMTSTASLASKNIKKLLALYILRSLNDLNSLNSLKKYWGGKAPLRGDRQSASSQYKHIRDPESLHETQIRALADWCFHQPWQQNNLSWSLNVECTYNEKSTILLIFGTLSLGGCGDHPMRSKLILKDKSQWTDTVFVT